MGHDIFVMGASAGGVAALTGVVGCLPPDFPGSVFIVLHIPAQGPDLLAEIMRRHTSLPVSNGRNREKIRPGHIYLAPPDHHLQVVGDRIRLFRGPRENLCRPSIDTLFRSAAESQGRRVVGVVLTGYLDDGTAGLNAIKTHGGIAIVQDPKEAVAPGMPQSALRNVKVDHCVALAEIGPLLVRLATRRGPQRKRGATVGLTKRQMVPKEMVKRFGRPTAFVCPECNGPLWETKAGPSLQFRCHVGHAYSPESLLADHANGLERALWSAVRTFDEQAALLRRLGQRGVHTAAHGTSMETRARKFEADAGTIRKLLQTSQLT